MSRWMFSLGLILVASFALGQIDGIETGTYNLSAGGTSANAQTGPNRWHYLQQPFNDSGSWQNLSLSAPFRETSATKMIWNLQSNGTGPTSDNKTSAQIQTFNLKFQATADFSITAHSITTSMALTQTDGNVQGTRTLVVKNMIVKAFGHVIRLDGPVAPNTVVWSGNGIEVIANKQSVSIGPVDVDMSVSAISITFTGIDLGAGNNTGAAIFSGITAHLESVPSS